MSKVASLLSRLGDVAGLIATPLVPSEYVALVWPLAASRARKARVEAVHDEAPGVRTLTLRPGRGWRAHRAGQHVQVGLAIDGRVTTRTYSISSAPERSDGCITITVKAQPGGRLSRVLVEQITVGTFLTVGLPSGDFVLTQTSRPLFITAGSGITPIASMIRSAAARGQVPEITHVHYARTPADEIFGEELRTLQVDHPAYKFIVVHTAHGRRRFDELVPDWRVRETWACGPQGLLEDVERVFAAAGRSDALHVERFRPKLAPLPANTEGGRVRFATSGVEVRADGRTALLQVSEAAGLALRHGCRMGICHSCDTILTSGCVRDLRTGASIDEPGTRIQICVCAAAGDVELQENT
ncbi:MAG: ferredoxin reductase [Deltaproteobacteria bacterium]|nr:ferredoxin reductase [Deltaproteobacteria bacterium]